MDFHHDWSTKRIRSFQGKLLRWYSKHRRDLPWRINPTPYRVWISEVMLQQTQARTVVPYYKRFLEQFPDVDSLARASERRVLELWAGLGYYGRARNLHKAAKQIVKIHGRIPEEFSAILALPGVGRYTAGAICSLAFNHAQPVVDGNIRRVLTRLSGTKLHVPENYHWNQMSLLLPKKKASAFNQAMMELGAIICLPSKPQCPDCPVKHFCKALELGIQNSIPKAHPKRAFKYLRIVTLILEQDSKILLTSSGKPKFIPGEWGLPCDLVANRESAEEAGIRLCRRFLGRAMPLAPCPQNRHSISNYRISVYAFYGKGDFAVRSLNEPGSFRWASRSLYKKLLTSSLFQKVLDNVEDCVQRKNKGGPSKAN
jgi:A/G-specific adenine glycosylase